MKKISMIIFMALIFFSCEKTEKRIDKLEFTEVIPGGCAININANQQKVNFDRDTVYYNTNKDSLSIFIGFNAECGPNHKTEAEISNDTIYIYLERKPGPFASCDCYFTYDFHFSGIVDPYYYVVNVDNWKYFYGFIEP